MALKVLPYNKSINILSNFKNCYKCALNCKHLKTIELKLCIFVNLIEFNLFCNFASFLFLTLPCFDKTQYLYIFFVRIKRLKLMKRY